MTTHWKATLERTAFTREQLPSEEYPEVAVAGRSNVGKSALINCLLGAKLAHVGATPGKTRSVNFFLVQREGLPFRIVDLPGYGYASRSKAERDTWSRLIESYVASRHNLLLALHLVDFRHGLLPNDAALQEWLHEAGVPLFVVFTKGDKIASGKHLSTKNRYIRAGLKSVDVPIVTSSEKGTGIQELRAFVEAYLDGEEQALSPRLSQDL